MNNIFHKLGISTLNVHNFLDKNPISINLAPLMALKRSRTGLFNGTKFIKNGCLLTKLGGFELRRSYRNKLFLKNPIL